MIKGKNIVLRALEPDDLDFLFNMENDTEFWNVSDTQTPFSRYILYKYIQNSHQDIYQAKQLRLVIDLNGKPIGTIDLYDFDPQHKRAGTGILILKKYQNKGYALETLRLLINYAFKTLNLHQLYADINENNIKSIKLFERCSFSKSGIKKDWRFYNNKYHNVLFYQLINKTQ